MRERGGPTTQSGILYQNSVASLYLGRLCDATRRPEPERVVRVRVEAPEHVDDTLVTFADGHHAFIQAKENVREDHEAWRTLWRDFDAQSRRPGFRRGVDRLLLHVGEIHDEHHDLRELCRRARSGGSYSEWSTRLTKPQQALVECIKPLLAPESLGDEALLDFFGHVDVEIWSLEQVERDLAPFWMPRSDRAPGELFRLLRDRVGGKARHRDSYTAEALRASLAAEGTPLIEPPDIESLREAVRGCGALLRQHKCSIGRTGRHVGRDVVGEILAWAAQAATGDRVAMLLDRAGMGKTVVTRDVLCALEDAGVTVLAIKADQQLSGLASHEQLQAALRLPEPVERVIGRLAALGPVVVIVDQVDALSLSLARDQRALDLVLELVARLRLIPGVRVLLSCRAFDRNGDPRLKRIEVRREFPLAGLPDDMVGAILGLLGVAAESLSPATRELLRVPLHLDLFAMAVQAREARLPDPRLYGAIVTLQDLYHLVWRDVILRADPTGPLASERVEVLERMTERMAREQRTTLPQAMFTTAEAGHLERALGWLASAGILVPGGTEWGLLHQTFFDYCYARRFVERGEPLAAVLVGARQGLFERPLLIQVLAYLRGAQPRKYLGELQELLAAAGLRPHLRDLLIRWFGAEPDPTDGEWSVAYRVLLDPAARPRLLAAMAGNPGWFARINGGPLRALLEQDDQVVDSQVIPYLISLVDAIQGEVVKIARGLAARGGRWANRAAWIVAHIREWRAPAAAELFEQLAGSLDNFLVNQSYQFDGIAKADPRAGCRLVRLLLDRVLLVHIAQREDRSRPIPSSLSSELEQLNGGTFHDILGALSRSAPADLVECLVPWLEEAVQLTPGSTEDRPDYGYDELCHGWYDHVYVVRHDLIRALLTSLGALARSDMAIFRRWAARLEALPYRTPQQLLAQVYGGEPEILAADAHRFLLADRRRLDLGDQEQYESRQLIRAIDPFLTSVQRVGLEGHIIDSPRLWKRAGLVGLRWRGLDQLYLLGAFPPESLTPRGRSYLDELERRFPGVRASETPIGMIGGWVESPIACEQAGKMSDHAWLRAMGKYRGGVRHSHPLRGGAGELGGVLLQQVKEDPGRFYRLVGPAPMAVVGPYAGAFINGLAESQAPAGWVFDVVRKFARGPGEDNRRIIAWALNKRVEDGLPADLLDMLEGWVRDRSIPDREGRDDPHNAYINSERGGALGTLMRGLDRQATDAARDRGWGLIEFVASDPSTSLRAGAVEELLRLLGDDRARAIDLFERLMDGHPDLLRSHDTREFLYHGLYKNFGRLSPCIRALMAQAEEEHRQRGAELACIAAISPSALESEEERGEARRLTAEILSGPPPWRRGAARVFAENLTLGPAQQCLPGLLRLLDDEDGRVRQQVAGAFHRLRGDHLFSLRGFVEAFASSRSLRAGLKPFAEYLWEHGTLDPPWTISIVDAALANPHEEDAGRRFMGVEELIRLVLRVHVDPTARAATRARAMDVFDRIMERHAGQANAILEEWDRR